MANLVLSVADQEFKRTASTGIYNFSMGLIHALAKTPGLNLTILANSTQNFGPQVPTERIERFDQATQSLTGRILWDQWGVYRAAKKTRSDWLLLPKGLSPILVPSPLQLAAYIHDLIPLLYPQTICRTKRLYLEQSYRATLRRADLIFTNTEYTRSEIQRWSRQHRIPCPPIHVVGYGFSAPETPPSTAKKEQILVLIRPDSHKRPDLSLRYMERWHRESGYKGTVLWVGCQPSSVQAPANPDWEWTGRIPSHLCLQYMRESRAVVHCTEYEGFGMPPVEAILAGTCPVFSAIPVSLEVMGGCGCGFDNAKYETFFQAMQQALHSTTDQIDLWRRKLKQRHNWEQVASAITSLLQ